MQAADDAGATGVDHGVVRLAATVRLPEPAVRALLRVTSRGVTHGDVSWVVQRRRYERASRVPLPRRTIVEPVTIAGVPGERVTARGADAARTVLHLHGGGFCIGSPATHRGFASRLSAAVGAAVVVPAYRLAPEHPHPAALDDGLAVWRALRADPGTAPIALSGDSAGGWLALSITLRLLAAGEPVPASLVLISPAVDLAADHGADDDLVARDVMLTPGWLTRCMTSYAAGIALDDEELAPLRHDLAGLPRTLVVSGTDDLLAPEAEQLSAAVRAAGVDVTDVRSPGLWHIYPMQAGMVAAADDAVARIAGFVRGD